MKKGFTLIELLAVIVILAIVSIVAVPIMLNVIDKAKQGAAESSALGYIDAVEKQVMINKVKTDANLLIEPGEYTKAELEAKGLKIKGEVEDALVVINEKGKVSQARFYIDGYSLDYDGKKVVTNTVDDYSNEIESIINACSIEIGQEYTFDYTENEQTMEAPCKGKYKLEVWGAQGGDASSTYIGGYGAYSTGIVSLRRLEVLYINVGGKGSLAHNPDNVSGGYNGGGNGYAVDNRPAVQANVYNGSGGGATHIALESGLLEDLESYKGTLVDNKYYVSDKILIVAAGGGGGNFYNTSSSRNTIGVSGGGYTGATEVYTNSGRVIRTTSGTQTSEGYMTDTSNGFDFHASFGKGGEWNVWSAGGGGGFFGGGAGYGSATSGGGGSSYIASSRLFSDSTTTKHMACYNCSGDLLSSDTETNTIAALGVNSTAQSEYAKSGNGYAKITYLGR